MRVENFMRTLLSIIVVLLLLGTTVLIRAQSDAKALSYTRRDILRKTREAKSAQDFKELAGYYDAQSKLFGGAAAEQQRERDYALSHAGSKQYPLASERARLLHDYYESRRTECEALAKHYQKRASALSAPAIAEPAAIGQSTVSVSK